jgi:hypothetical protein
MAGLFAEVLSVEIVWRLVQSTIIPIVNMVTSIKAATFIKIHGISPTSKKFPKSGCLWEEIPISKITTTVFALLNF